MPRAVRFDRYGGVDVLYLADVPEPQPGAGQVVVEVVAAAINPGEIPVREGAFAEQWPATFPSGQGSDFAGRVSALGDDVHGWSVGDDVIGWTDERAAQADYVVVPADQLALRPPDVPWQQAACLHVAGCTAYGAVRAVSPASGETVVVFGAAGGVGSITVQLLRRLDVRVLGVAGESNAEWLRSVDVEPVTYGEGLGHRLHDLAPDGIAAAIDTYGGGYVELAVGLGVPADRVETIIDFAAAERFGTKAVGGSEVSSAGVLSELADMVSAGELTIPIAVSYPLEQVQDAYTRLAERHTRGKIVLDIGRP
jgi:NADPH:quinone reductase